MEPNHIYALSKLNFKICFKKSQIPSVTIDSMSTSLAPECNEKKERYDTCFLKWYSEKYLRGNVTKDDCTSLFDEYKACLSIALKDRGIDKMLDSARADHRENGAVNLRKFESSGYTLWNIDHFS